MSGSSYSGASHTFTRIQNCSVTLSHHELSKNASMMLSDANVNVMQLQISGSLH